MKRVLVTLIALSSVLVGTPSAATVSAQVGLLDPSFGGNGRVTTALGGPTSNREDSANGVVVQPDGKIVVAGTIGCRANYLSPECSIAVLRYHSDGTLDPSFGGDGVVLTHFSSGAGAADVALQPDGKIVVAGSAAAADGVTWGFAVARYDSNGTLDATFDGDGRVKTFLGGEHNGSSLALQPDGKIVVAGSGIVRYGSDGSLDAGFGLGGYVASTWMSDVALQADGKIVTAAFAYRKFGVYRFEADGSPDITFDLDGKATMAAPTGSLQAHSVGLQADGRIVVAGGYRKDPGIRRFALGRLTSDGNADSTFGGDGLVTTRIGGDYAVVRSIAIQPDRRIVVVGGIWYGSPYQDNAEVSAFGVVRFNRGGALDRRFSGDGKVVTYAGTGFPFEQAMAVALQPDGAILVAGEAGRHGGDVAVLRYLVPVSRPDGSIKQRSRPFFVGDDAYGAPGWRQSWITTTRREATFLIRAENDGSASDRFVFEGCGPTSSFTVRYLSGGTPVTARVVEGTYERGPVAPGGTIELVLTIRVRPGASIDRLACSIRIRSAMETTKEDVVRAVVYVGPAGCFPTRTESRGEVRAGCAP